MTRIWKQSNTEFSKLGRLPPESRYDITRPDSDRTNEGGSFRTLTKGLDFYLWPYTDSIKFQGKVTEMFGPEAESLVAPDTLTIVGVDPGGGK